MPRLLVTAAAVLAGAFVLRCLEGCSAWVAAALVCAAAAPVTAYWLDLAALEPFDRAAAVLASGLRRCRLSPAWERLRAPLELSAPPS